MNHWRRTINSHQSASFHKCKNPAALSQEKRRPVLSLTQQCRYDEERIEVLKFDGFTWPQSAVAALHSAAPPFSLAFYKCNGKTADVTFIWIDWNDDKLTSCWVMVLINTNHAFWWRLTDLLAARTSGSGERERKLAIQIKRTTLRFPTFTREHSGIVQFPHLAFPPVMNNSGRVRRTWERASQK